MMDSNKSSDTDHEAEGFWFVLSVSGAPPNPGGSAGPCTTPSPSSSLSLSPKLVMYILRRLRGGLGERDLDLDVDL
jgi:hypothetical protein